MKLPKTDPIPIRNRALLPERALRSPAFPAVVLAAVLVALVMAVLFLVLGCAPTGEAAEPTAEIVAPRTAGNGSIADR